MILSGMALFVALNFVQVVISAYLEREGEWKICMDFYPDIGAGAIKRLQA